MVLSLNELLRQSAIHQAFIDISRGVRKGGAQGISGSRLTIDFALLCFQRLKRMASCMTLGSVTVLVMLPKAGEPKPPLG